MKKVLSMFLVFALLLTFVPAIGASAKANANERVIVLFKDKVNKNLVTQAKGKINREYKNVRALAITVPAVAINGLKKNPNVLAVEVDQKVQVKAQTQDWGVAKIDAPTSWNAGYTGKGVKIAVVDTGITRHEDLVISGGASFTSYTTSYNDDNGHGTHVAGIIGAKNNGYGSVGAAYDSSIYAVKALDQNGSGYLSDIVAGIDWSITNQMDIINLSLGTTSSSTTLKQVVDKAYSQGILVVAAAGNNGTSDGSGDTVNYPARYESAIAVAATDSYDKRASFSATGGTVEVSAPGVNILSTYLNNSYVKMNGTSMATPYVAANLALLMEANPTLSAVELRSKLQQTVIDLGTAGKDNWFGHGLVQAPTQGAPEQEVPGTEEPVTTTTKVTTNKSTYLAGEQVSISVNVSDNKGNLVNNASVTVTIYPPKGNPLVGTGLTDSNGSITFILSTTKRSTKGTYKVQADSATTDNISSTGTTGFQLK